MSIWNKILLGLIFPAAVAFAYLAMRQLKIEDHWRDKAADFEARIEKAEHRQGQLVDGVKGDPDQPGIQQLQLKLSSVMTGRQRIWTDCMPRARSIIPDAPSFTVDISSPDPHKMFEGMVVQIFEQPDDSVGRMGDPGQTYLGEFEVVKADQEREVDVRPTRVVVQPELSDADKAKPLAEQVKLRETLYRQAYEARTLGDAIDFARLQNSRGPWMIRQSIPPDRHDLFRELTADEIRDLIQPEHVHLYLADGKTVDELPDSILKRLSLPPEDLAKMFADARQKLAPGGDPAAVSPEALENEVDRAVDEAVDDDALNGFKTDVLQTIEVFTPAEVLALSDVDQSTYLTNYLTKQEGKAMLIAKRESADGGEPVRYFKRRLQDPGADFKEFFVHHSHWVDQTRRIQLRQEALDWTVADAKLEVTFREKLIADVGKQLERSAKEIAWLTTHRDRLDALLKEKQADVNGVAGKNLLMARKIAVLQLEAAERINQRTQIAAGGQP
ncbi:MAG: hypothetical protein HQ581_17400 [Planctomycetes bacterium]|nr:hypothetical protein [Planctomycetota bacterium]